jgi:hypothetical protein
MMGVLGITCGVMVWAGVALLGLHLIIEKMAWLHTIIMVGGVCICAGWVIRCCAARLKNRMLQLPLRRLSWRRADAASERSADQSGEP